MITLPSGMCIHITYIHTYIYIYYMFVFMYVSSGITSHDHTAVWCVPEDMLESKSVRQIKISINAISIVITHHIYMFI
jgi:hypothetical protein